MNTTTIADTWTDADDRHLASALACHARLVDYDVIAQWHAEMRGDNNELRLGVATAGRVEADSPEWLALCGLRTWWHFLRIDAGLSLEEAAGQIGVNQGTVSRWERGLRDPTGDPGERYQAWLVGQRFQLVAASREEILELAARRDRWPYLPTGEEREAIWREFWRAGGWADQWRRTGVLPNTNRLEPN